MSQERVVQIKTLEKISLFVPLSVYEPKLSFGNICLRKNTTTKDTTYCTCLQLSLSAWTRYIFENSNIAMS